VFALSLDGLAAGMPREFWISTAITVITMTIGLVFTGYWGKKSVPRKQPMWTSVTLNEVTTHTSYIEGLEVLYRYKGQQVPQLSRSNIAFWNAGRIAIRSSDVIRQDPLELCVLGGYQLLDVNPLQNTDKVNGFIMQRVDDTRVALSFDYLGAGQGVVVQMTHTGRSDESVKLTGGFIDADNLRHIPLYDKDLAYSKAIGDLRMSRISPFGKWLGTLIGLLISGSAPFFAPWITGSSRQHFGLITWIFLITQLFISLRLIYALWVPPRKVRRIPRGLDLFQGILSGVTAMYKPAE